MPFAILLAGLVSLSGATTISSAFDATDNEKLLELSLSIGGCFCLSLLLTFPLLFYSKGSFAKAAMWLTPCAGKGAQCMLWMTRLLLLGVPIGLIIGWGVSTGIVIEPHLIGESVSCTVGFVVLWALAMVHWCLNYHRLSNWVLVAFGLSFALLAAALLIVVYDHLGGFEYRVCTAVYMTLNMMLVCKLHFDWTSSVEDFPEYVKTFETHADQ